MREKVIGSTLLAIALGGCVATNPEQLKTSERTNEYKAAAQDDIPIYVRCVQSYVSKNYKNAGPGDVADAALSACQPALDQYARDYKGTLDSISIDAAQHFHTAPDFRQNQAKTDYEMADFSARARGLAVRQAIALRSGS